MVINVSPHKGRETTVHACPCVHVHVCWSLCYRQIEMEQINAPARGGPERVTNHLIRGKMEELGP